MKHIKCAKFLSFIENCSFTQIKTVMRRCPLYPGSIFDAVLDKPFCRRDTFGTIWPNLDLGNWTDSIVSIMTAEPGWRHILSPSGNSILPESLWSLYSLPTLSHNSLLDCVSRIWLVSRFCIKITSPSRPFASSYSCHSLLLFCYYHSIQTG